MKIIVGLGNPGAKYEKTRHNVGVVAVDEISKAFSFEAFKEAKKHKAVTAEGEIGGEKILLVKPQTFMNLSGESAQSLQSFYKLRPDEIIVIYDDVDIDQGEVRLRAKGSAAGHNGIKSIIENLGTDEFIRVRVGMKPIHPFHGELTDYVLGKISIEEEEKLQPVLEALPKIIETYLSDGIEVAMNEYH